MSPPPNPAARALPNLDARTLRVLGEFADGYRDQDFSLVQMQDGTVTLRDAAKPASGEVQVLAAVRTASKFERERPAVQLKTSQINIPVGDQLDALFWTESSIEKFLIPYYCHMRTLDEQHMAGLSQVLAKNEKLVAMGHIPPSQETVIANPGDSLQLFFADSPKPVTLKTFLQTGRNQQSPGR